MTEKKVLLGDRGFIFWVIIISASLRAYLIFISIYQSERKEVLHEHPGF